MSHKVFIFLKKATHLILVLYLAQMRMPRICWLVHCKNSGRKLIASVLWSSIYTPYKHPFEQHQIYFVTVKRKKKTIVINYCKKQWRQNLQTLLVCRVGLFLKNKITVWRNEEQTEHLNITYIKLTLTESLFEEASNSRGKHPSYELLLFFPSGIIQMLVLC